jgi:predicted secreted protein
MLNRNYANADADRSRSDKAIDVAAGDTVEIQLPENATTGYRWTLKTIDKSVCEVIANERHSLHWRT